MKYLSLFTPSRSAPPPTKEHMDRMGKLIEESMKSGVLLMTGGLMPIAQGGAHVRRSGDDIAVIDGPFAETKELVGGFAILQANSKGELIEMVRNFLEIAGDGETEVHQIMEPGAQPCDS